LVTGITKGSEIPEHYLLPLESLSNFINYLASMPETCKEVLNGNFNTYIKGAQNFVPNFVKRYTGTAVAKPLTQNQIMLGGAVVVSSVGLYKLYTTYKNTVNSKPVKIAKYGIYGALSIIGLITTISSFNIIRLLNAFGK